MAVVEAIHTGDLKALTQLLAAIPGCRRCSLVRLGIGGEFDERGGQPASGRWVQGPAVRRVSREKAGMSAEASVRWRSGRWRRGVVGWPTGGRLQPNLEMSSAGRGRSA